MVSKKGFIRTIEAVIAILLIFGFILFIQPDFSKNQQIVTPEIVVETQEFLFSEIAYNDQLRECVLDPPLGNPSTGSCSDVCGMMIEQFIQQNLPFGFTYACEICDGPSSCLGQNLPIDRNVYANSIFLAASPSKILRLYLWES